eukprot:s624_g3.t1
MEYVPTMPSAGLGLLQHTEDSFDRLMERLNAAHVQQVATLNRKVERLRRQLRNCVRRGYPLEEVSEEMEVVDESSTHVSQDIITERIMGLGITELFIAIKKIPDNGPKMFVFNSRNISAASYNPTTSKTLRQCETLLNNPTFEALLCFVIFLNAVVFALEAQNKGMAYGHIGFGGDLPDLFWSNGDDIFYVLEMVFGVVFTVEVIVLVWILGQVFEERLPVNSQVLRLARLIRLFRLLRLVRRIQQFDSLYLMSTAIRSSSGILGWTAALLFLIQMLFALVFNQLLYGFYFSDSDACANRNISAETPAAQDEFVKDQQEIVYTYFGTFSRSLLTMFEITLANWPPVCRVLTENVSEWFMIFFLVHKVTMGFAVIGVINGVLMQETFKDTIMMRTKQKAMENHIRKMQLLFEEADTSEDGRIDLQEFKEIVADNELKAWLGAMELELLGVGDGVLTFGVNGLGCCRLASGIGDLLWHGAHVWPKLHSLHSPCLSARCYIQFIPLAKLMKRAPATDHAGDNSGGLTAEQLVLGVAKLQGLIRHDPGTRKVIKEQQGMMKKVEKLQKGFRILAEQCLPPSPSGASRINSESDEFVSF